MENLDYEAIKIMKVGGEEFCDGAIKKWLSKTYYAGASQKQKLEMIERWKNIKDRIGIITKRLIDDTD